MVNFLVNGVLPSGIHEYSFNEFHDQFVLSFKNSATREKILEGAMVFLNKICNYAAPSEMWLDGSYVTTKINPNDIDLVLFFDDHVLAPVWGDIKPILCNSKSFFCDAYMAVNGDHKARSYWRGWFTYDRLENPKGVIKLNPVDFAKSIYEVVLNGK